jgi:hypothetical protein
MTPGLGSDGRSALKMASELQHDPRCHRLWDTQWTCSFCGSSHQGLVEYGARVIQIHGEIESRPCLKSSAFDAPKTFSIRYLRHQRQGLLRSRRVKIADCRP